ncbi:cyanophycinase [Kitasatospora sp. A2-31]|uniref:cyanophycinase n=1 Tax=Kitasatospora sp. A2-31 TaxID=2916414 RepID=UPI001EE9DAB6|nr:cyanophycinase [Kitasatospora sp. A2-31]MCG6498407.1 cyanophycinase [Kitasatospora sp. A2-31]
MTMSARLTVSARPARRRAAGPAIAAMALAAALASPTTSAQAAAPATGSLILAGGAVAATNSAVYGTFITRAGGTATAPIGVITAASDTPTDDPNADDPATCNNSVCNGKYYVDLLKNTYGAADAQWIPIDLDHVSNNASQGVVNQINSMTGFFFGGGDQSRLVATLLRSDNGDSPALAAIRARFAAGAAIMGTSAGTTIANGRDMVTGGESWDGLRYGSYTSVSAGYPDDLTYRPEGGFDFFTSGLLDTHFAARGREGRITRLAADTGHTRAFGIDEDTALVVTNPGSTGETDTVVGTNGVSVLDLRSATIGTHSGYWSVDNVNWSYLTSGDSYNPATWTVTSPKPAYSPGTGTVGSRWSDVFSSAAPTTGHPYQMVRMATELVNAGRSTHQYGISYESGPTFEADLTKGTGFRAWKSGTAVSFTNLTTHLYVY